MTDPTSVPNLWAWYDAGSGVIGGTSVTAWNDSSTNGNNLLQATSTNQPMQVMSMLNGLPVVALKSNAAQARMTTAANFPFTTGATIFLVAAQVNTNDASGTFVNYSLGSAIERNVSGSGITADLNGATLVSGAATDGTYYTIRTMANATNLTLYMNGTLQNTGTIGTAVTQQPFNIFQMNDGSNNGNKKFAEIVVYNRLLSLSECATVESYLRTKYAHY